MIGKLVVITLLGSVFFACNRSFPTVSLVYNSTFPKDTIINLEKILMSPAQLNARCMLLSNDKILIRTSTSDDAIYSVFSYPEMKHLAYFGSESEYVVPIEQFNDDLYLVRGDSLCFYKWIEGDSLKQFSTSYFYNVMGQRMLGVAKMNDNLYAYCGNYNDRGNGEFFMIDLLKREKKTRGVYPNSSVGFSSIHDFKSAYAHDIVSKPDGSHLLVFYLRTRRFRIYNREGILLNDILLNYEPCQYVVDTNIKKRFSHVRDVFVTDDKIYLLCLDTRKENSTSSLIVAKWNGEFLARYHLDKYISYFFIDEMANRFCGINSDDPYYFYLFELDKN